MATYKTENPQEVFDFVVQKLYEQGGPARMGSTCMYRAERGRRCAFGWLIPDDEYVREMECRILDDSTGRLSHVPGVEVPDRVAALQVVHNAKLIRELQQAHDYSLTEGLDNPVWIKEPGSFHTIDGELRKVAEKFELDSSIIDRTFGSETNGSQA